MVWFGPDPVLDFVTKVGDIAEEQVQGLILVSGLLEDRLPVRPAAAHPVVER